MNKGLLITFEGPDGSGKSTQIEYMKEYFNDNGIECVFTREPGGTHIGELLREIILDKHNNEMCDMTEALLYAASRAQHVDEKIRPAIEEGKIVVCDRYIDSSMAYQGYGRHLGEKIASINEFAVMGYMPDLTFFLDVDPKVGRQRIGKDEQDRLESEKLLFHRNVYKGYVKIAEENPERVIRIDGTGTREEMRDQIIKRIEKLLEERNSHGKEDDGGPEDNR